MDISINKKIFVLIVVMFVTIVAIIGFAQLARANPSLFGPRASSAIATSSPQYLTINSSTSTSTPVVYDSYNIDGTNQTNNGTTDLPDDLALKEYIVASSTSSILVTRVEYSDGIAGVSCVSTPNACDWYENNLENYASGAIAIATPNTWTWTYASTTPGAGAIVAGSNRGSKVIGVKVPMRYARAYVTISGANGSVYLEWVPKRQLK